MIKDQNNSNNNQKHNNSPKSSRREWKKLFAAHQLGKGKAFVDVFPDKIEGVEYESFIHGIARVLTYLFGISKTRVVALLSGYNRRCVHPITIKQIKVIVEQAIRAGSPLSGPVR